MGEADEVLEPVARAAPPADFRRAHEKIPREPHRYSGRTAMRAQENVHEQRPPDDKDAPLAHSMEGFPGVPPAALTPFYWRAAWNSVQATKDYITEPPPGVRLIGLGRGNPQAGSDRAETFQPRKGEWLLLPEYHVFGSDELSARSPAIARRAPSPYLRLGREDAASLSLGEGEQVFVRTEGTEHHLPVVIDATLPAGLAGYPVGLPGSAMVELPAWVRIGKGGP
jgi:NADH-quinone oxidoreductase subunit G